MIREMAEPNVSSIKDYLPVEEEQPEEEEVVEDPLQLPPREVSSKQQMRERKELAIKAFSHKSATMSMIDGLIQSPRISKELRQSIEDKKYDGLNTFYDNKVKEMMPEDETAGTTQVTFLTSPTRPTKGFRDAIREKFNRTQEMKNMEKNQKRVARELGGSINFENLD